MTQGSLSIKGKKMTDHRLDSNKAYQCMTTLQKISQD